MTTDSNGMPLLIVDDEAGIRKVLSITLADMGYQVFSAADGEEALTLFDRHLPRIVLADIKMPGMSGIDLLKAIKARRADTEVIMMTGHGDMASAIESLQLDATDFITKPLHDGAIEVALKRAGERIALRDQLARYTRHLEQLVAEKSRQLIEAERMAAIGQTVAGLSHTIKNIVGGLTGGAYGVAQGLQCNDPGIVQEGWPIVKSNVDKLARLSMDMLNYAKTAQCRPSLASPNAAAREAADVIRPRLQKAGITLNVELGPDLEPVFYDPEMIYQALLNLLVNALEAFHVIERQNPCITLKTTRPVDWAVAYHVLDNGCGMDQHVQDNLFRTFFTTKGSAGTGFGLMMTRNIMEQHGGKIEVKSTPGQGTEVVLMLPEKNHE